MVKYISSRIDNIEFSFMVSVERHMVSTPGRVDPTVRKLINTTINGVSDE